MPLRIGQIPWMDRVVVCIDLPDQGLSNEPAHLTEATTKWHKRLIVVGRTPVRGNDRRCSQEPAVLHVIGDEVLRQKLV